MARTRAATYDEQRELILARAAELFARRGYAGTSMSEVAAASHVSKATLYHYVRDKHALLAQTAEAHVARLQALVAEVAAQRLAPAEHLRSLIERFTQAYSGAQNEHRVLTEDVKFLRDPERTRVVAAQKDVVAAFARAIAALRPELEAQATPLAMLLFGMINWTFTWLKPGGPLTHEALAPMVADLFFGGLPAVPAPAGKRHQRGRSAVTLPA